MKDYLLIYLFCDVLILTEAFQKFREIIFNIHKLDPAHFVTLPSLSMEAALFDSKIEIDLLNDITVFNEIENNICGGFTSVVQSRNTFNNPNLDNFDESQQLSSGVFLDVNALYSKILSDKLPYGDLYELSIEEINEFEINSIDIDGDYAYVLSIDFSIPDNVKSLTDDLPLSMSNEKIEFDDLSPYQKKLMADINMKFIKQKSLIASHKSQKNYLISLPLLKLYIELGIEIEKINSIYRFKQK